jgi:hypothetical protein
VHNSVALQVLLGLWAGVAVRLLSMLRVQLVFRRSERLKADAMWQLASLLVL